ncbi:MAG: 50S ribosomal protein L18 [Candidatus Omnitrophota bacterium]
MRIRKKQNIREINRISKHRRIRKRLSGTPDVPRLCVHRSLKNFSAQVIDDTSSKVLFGMTTLNKDVASQIDSKGGNISAAAALGKAFAEAAKAKGVTKVCFDRGGYLYHGRVKAFADAARENGLDF